MIMDYFVLEKPTDFVYLADVAPDIQQEVRYYGKDNFLGRPVKGYHKPICMITLKAAQALIKVQRELKAKGLAIKVYDCYRPQVAVDDFIAWSKDAHDQKMKAEYYPRVNKADFFKLNYVATRSSHTRGSTVDLTIIDPNNGHEVDMGTHFDFMDELSHPLNRHVSYQQYSNRMLLRNVMIKAGFEPIETEWWHFTLKAEPYPYTYFNFEIE